MKTPTENASTSVDSMRTILILLISMIKNGLFSSFTPQRSNPILVAIAQKSDPTQQHHLLVMGKIQDFSINKSKTIYYFCQ